MIACAWAANLIKADYVRPDQTVIDVGINMQDGALCGDVDFEAAAKIVGAITPVPGAWGR